MPKPATDLDSLIDQYADQYGVPRGEAHALAMVESGKSQNAISPVGAIGVYQLMPGTAQGLGVNPYNLAQNVAGGLQYYAQQRKAAGGDWKGAYAAYNGGPKGFAAYKAGRPYAETAAALQRFQGYLGGTSSSMRTKTPNTPSGIPYAPLPKAAQNALGRAAAAKAYSGLPPINVGTQTPDAIQKQLLAPVAPANIPNPPSLYDPNAPTPNPLTHVPIGMGMSVPLPPGLSLPSDMTQLGTLVQKAAPEPVAADAARQWQGQLAGASAVHDALMGVHAPTFTPYAPPALPTHAQMAVPEWQYQPPSDAVLGLGALASLLDPGAAGNFMAAPLQAAQQNADQTFQGALQRYTLEQQQNEAQYQDMLRQAQWQQQAEMYNREGAQGADNAAYQLALSQANAAGPQAQAQAMVGAYQGAIPADEARIQAGIQAQQLQARMQMGMQNNANQMQGYGAQVGGIVDAYQQQLAEQRARLGLAQNDILTRADQALRGQGLGLEAQRIGNEATAEQNRNALGWGQLRQQATAEQNRNTLGWSQLGLDAKQETFKEQHGTGKTDLPPTLDLAVLKDPDVVNALGEVNKWTAEQRKALGGIPLTDKFGNPTTYNPKTDPAMQQINKHLQDALGFLQRQKNLTYNRYAHLYGAPPLNLDAQGNLLASPQTAADRNKTVAGPGGGGYIGALRRGGK